MDTNANVVYRIDSQDRIVFVNDVWQQFALSNQASDCTVEKVLDRSIWDFINEDTTLHFYREVVQAARSKKNVTFNFRCDSPDYRRFMKMTVSAVPAGQVQFETELLKIEPRTSQPTLDRHAWRSRDLVVICGWCKKINIGQAIWKEIEHAVKVLRIFEEEHIPQLSHGMCSGCYSTISEQLRTQFG